MAIDPGLKNEIERLVASLDNDQLKTVVKALRDKEGGAELLDAAEYLAEEVRGVLPVTPWKPNSSKKNS
jgi:hypothetical protein